MASDKQGSQKRWKPSHPLTSFLDILFDFSKNPTILQQPPYSAMVYPVEQEFLSLRQPESDPQRLPGKHAGSKVHIETSSQMSSLG
jgi:hypothetical protein